VRERGRDNFLRPRESCFSSFFVRSYSCCNELLLELLLEIFRPSFCCFATVSGLCNSSAFSSAFVPFAPNPIFSFHQNNNERTYYSITISQRRERKREKEKGEKLFAAFPSHRRKTSSTKQKRDREIERITHKHRRRELCFVPNSARIFKKKR